MIVKELDEIIDSERDVHGQTWNSRRLLLADDRMGFSLHDTLIHPGTETTSKPCTASRAKARSRCFPTGQLT